MNEPQAQNDLLRRLWRTARRNFLEQRSRQGLKYLGRAFPPSPGPHEVTLFVAVRDEALRLPYFFDHYRALGVRRFVAVDNGSRDDTLAILREQRDTLLFGTRERFVDADCGARWANVLLPRLARDRWCLTVDADELFVYPQSPRLPLPKLCEYLEDERADALEALLLDLHSDRPIRQTHYRRGTNPVEACPFFEPVDGYYGGVRQRVFGLSCFLRKTPLFKMSRGLRIGLGWHFLEGASFSRLRGAVLHTKYLSDFHERVAQVAATGNHWDHGSEYARYHDRVTRDPALTLMGERSVRYEGPEQLVRLGQMRSTPEFDRYAQSLA